jgi:hypothetical protein
VVVHFQRQKHGMYLYTVGAYGLCFADQSIEVLPITTKGQSIWKDSNFRLDSQGRTSDQDWKFPRIMMLVA